MGSMICWRLLRKYCDRVVIFLIQRETGELGHFRNFPMALIQSRWQIKPYLRIDWWPLPSTVSRRMSKCGSRHGMLRVEMEMSHRGEQIAALSTSDKEDINQTKTTHNHVYTELNDVPESSPISHACFIYISCCPTKCGLSSTGSAGGANSATALT
jgi:hypothetical protein